MRQLHAERISRVGIVAAVVDQGMERLLMLKHKESKKTKAGMWGVLSETAIVAAQGGGGWRLEAPMDTVARGLQEEVSVTPPGQLWVPSKVPSFSHEWPIGLDTDQVALAICPVVVVDGALAEAIERAPDTEEISATEFVPLDRLEGREFRPGISRWLPHALDAIDSNRGSALVEVRLPVDQLLGPTQDAILDNMYGPLNG